MFFILLLLAIVAVPVSLFHLIFGTSEEKEAGLFMFIIAIAYLKIFHWAIRSPKDNNSKTSPTKHINPTPIEPKIEAQTPINNNISSIYDITEQDIIDKNVEFTDDAIYLRKKEWDGVKWTIRKQKVYVYKRNYHLGMGEPPRFHICKCSTIDSFLSRGLLKTEYRKSSDIEVWVRDMDTGDKETKISHLPLCGNCYKKMKRQYTWLDSKTDNETFIRRVIKQTYWAEKNL